MSALPHRLRLAVAMGQHRRLGRSSHLRRLPLQLAEVVLDLALPRTPCRLEITTTMVLLPGQSSSSSSSSSSSEDGDDEDTDSSSSSGDDEQQQQHE